MVNLPAGIKLDQNQIQTLKFKVIKKVESTLNIKDFEQYIACEKTLNPQQIESQTGSYLGSLYGLNSNSMLNAFYRPKSKDKNFKNLFYTGGSVHPGGGMPLAVQSAILLDQIIE
jgi:phytoene dehydrogenase-like protein